MIPVRGYRDCFVGVLGLGLSGIATAKALESGGASPLCWDDDQAVRREAKKCGVQIHDLNSDSILNFILEIYLTNEK